MIYIELFSSLWGDTRNLYGVITEMINSPWGQPEQLGWFPNFRKLKL